MSESRPDQDFKPNTPLNEESIREGLNFSKECRPAEELESMISYRIDKKRIRSLDTGTSKRGGSAEVELAILLPWDASEPLSTEEYQHIAVKKLKVAEDFAEGRVLRSLMRELGLLRRLSHANTVVLIGFVEDIPEGIAWMIFPWEANGNIREFLQSGSWEIPERISLIYDVACGIHYLHTQQPPICHGDLKSANILVNSESRAVITDFGSARLLERTSEGPTDNSTTPNRSTEETKDQESHSIRLEMSGTHTVITVTGPAWTLRWASPEVLDGELPDLPSDIWAFGWICWEVMTDSYPFAEIEQDTAVVLHVVTGDLPSVENNSHTSQMRELCDLMDECWKLDPQLRPSAKKCMTKTGWMTKITPSRRSQEDGIQYHSAGLLRATGKMHVDHGRIQEGITDLQKALDIFRSTNDNKGVAETLCTLGEAYFRIDENSKSEAAYLEAQEISSRRKDDWDLGRALSGLAKIYNYQGDTVRARSSLIQVMQLYTRLGTELAIANANYELGMIYIDDPDYTEAESTLSKAYTLYTSLGADLGIANAAAALGQLLFLREDDIEAASRLEEAQNIYERIGERNGLARVLWHRATIHEQGENYEEAVALLEEARKIYIDLGVTQDIMMCDDHIQNLRNKRGTEAEGSIFS